MNMRLDRAHRSIPVVMAVIALASIGILMLCDINPTIFPANAHGILATFPLVMVAVAYLVYQSAHRPPPKEWFKALLLAVAFLFWALNQFWPNVLQATIFNDIAIALFALDVFLVIVGWPTTSPDESFAETCAKPGSQPARHRQTD